jgi:hypothetical protein
MNGSPEANLSLREQSSTQPEVLKARSDGARNSVPNQFYGAAKSFFS